MFFVASSQKDPFILNTFPLNYSQRLEGMQCSSFYTDNKDYWQTFAHSVPTCLTKINFEIRKLIQHEHPKLCVYLGYEKALRLDPQLEKDENSEQSLRLFC